MKIYETLIDNKLTTTVRQNGVPVRVEFSGGDSNSRGMFTTKDPELQKAIESSPGFNKVYKLLRTIKIEKPKVVEPVIEDNYMKEVPLDKGKAPLVFRTVNEAQAFLIQEPYNVAKSIIRTSTAVIEKAKEFGITVEFEKK